MAMTARLLLVARLRLKLTAIQLARERQCVTVRCPHRGNMTRWAGFCKNGERLAQHEANTRLILTISMARLLVFQTSAMASHITAVQIRRLSTGRFRGS